MGGNPQVCEYVKDSKDYRPILCDDDNRPVVVQGEQLELKPGTAIKTYAINVSNSATQLTISGLTPVFKILIQAWSKNAKSVFIGSDNTVDDDTAGSTPTTDTGTELTCGSVLELNVKETVTVYHIAEDTNQWIIVTLINGGS